MSYEEFSDARKYLITEGLPDLFVGCTAKRPNSNSVIVDPKSIHVSDLMEYWAKRINNKEEMIMSYEESVIEEMYRWWNKEDNEAKRMLKITPLLHKRFILSVIEFIYHPHHPILDYVKKNIATCIYYTIHETASDMIAGYYKESVKKDFPTVEQKAAFVASVFLACKEAGPERRGL